MRQRPARGRPAADRRRRRCPGRDRCSALARALPGLLVEAREQLVRRQWPPSTAIWRGSCASRCWQAVLSTVLSVVPAIAVARALSRHPDFPGRRLILRLFAFRSPCRRSSLRSASSALYGRAGYFAGVFSSLSGGTWPGSLRPLRHPGRPCLLQPAAGDAPLRRGARHRTRPTSGGWRANLGMRAVSILPLRRMAGDARPRCRASPASSSCSASQSFTIVLTLGGGPAGEHHRGGDLSGAALRLRSARAAIALSVLQIALTAVAAWWRCAFRRQRYRRRGHGGRARDQADGRDLTGRGDCSTALSSRWPCCSWHWPLLAPSSPAGLRCRPLAAWPGDTDGAAGRSSPASSLRSYPALLSRRWRLAAGDPRAPDRARAETSRETPLADSRGCTDHLSAGLWCWWCRRWSSAPAGSCCCGRSAISAVFAPSARHPDQHADGATLRLSRAGAGS